MTEAAAPHRTLTDEQQAQIAAVKDAESAACTWIETLRPIGECATERKAFKEHVHQAARWAVLAIRK